MRTRSRLLLTALAGAFLVASEAFGIVGRPLTPMSYAGVARRTTRRAVYAGAYGTYVPGSGLPGSLLALPAGCTAYRPCGGVTYAPQYQGTTVVYVPQ